MRMQQQQARAAAEAVRLARQRRMDGPDADEEDEGAARAGARRRTQVADDAAEPSERDWTYPCPKRSMSDRACSNGPARDLLW